jgi:hypothetical protein
MLKFTDLIENVDFFTQKANSKFYDTQIVLNTISKIHQIQNNIQIRI